MCLAIPSRIESIDGDRAVANLAGTRVQVVISLTPEVKVGDWVLVHAGYAITVVSDEDAHETFALLREMDGLSNE
jgi:hydrogenase expression/formation protein HypC